MIQIKCQMDDLDIMTLHEIGEGSTFLEIICDSTDLNESVSVWLDKGKAIQIISHLKKEFKL